MGYKREKKDSKRNANKPFRKRKRKPCIFCADKKTIDYKDVSFLKRFMTDRGKIGSRRATGCCALHQRMVAKLIKRARQLCLVPYKVD